MSSLLSITWTVGPKIIDLGPITLRWYGLLFAAAFLAGYNLMGRIFKREGIAQEQLDSLLMYMMIATVVGARLGHVFFYDWGYYSQNLSEIPKVWHGGLASHGAAIGIIVGMWLFSMRVSKRSVLWILDRVVITVALSGIFIRTGNFFNHEITGVATNLPWGVIFTLDPDNPTTAVHPAQLYEAFCYAIVFGILMYQYFKLKKGELQGYLFGMFLIMLFVARFAIEFVKSSQGGFETYFGNLLSTGQLLSIPFILAGFYFVLTAKQSPYFKATA